MASTIFLDKVQALLHLHKQGYLGGEVMPEDALRGIVPEKDLSNVLTLAMALNYQRDAYALWRAVAQAYQDEEIRWVFTPRTASAAGLEELRSSLLRHRVALQPNRHPDSWRRVAEGIVQASAAGDVAGMLEAADGDIAVLKDRMQGSQKASFPYLSGPKIFNYWLYVMETYAGVKWKSRELITVAPDTHILKATVQLGLCTADVLNGSADDRRRAAEAWAHALSGTGLAPIDVHTPLWLWSRAGFPSLAPTQE
ncbi:hypothetical protein [Gorillibacterium sp. CAU 1737]|uniref:hypothetical protein n=1 Tax=Gorillibacterium sp. CAU 1737 TaxID=3140362 RepID=UPI00326068F4